MLIDGWNQDVWSKLKAAVVGDGLLGQQIVENLAAMGIRETTFIGNSKVTSDVKSDGYLSFCDDISLDSTSSDKFDSGSSDKPDNKSYGKPIHDNSPQDKSLHDKSISHKVKYFLSRVNPNVKVFGIHWYPAAKSIEAFLDDVNVIFETTNNPIAKRRIFDYAKKTGKFLVSGFCEELRGGFFVGTENEERISELEQILALQQKDKKQETEERKLEDKKVVEKESEERITQEITQRIKQETKQGITREITQGIIPSMILGGLMVEEARKQFMPYDKHETPPLKTMFWYNLLSNGRFSRDNDFSLSPNTEFKDAENKDVEFKDIRNKDVKNRDAGHKPMEPHSVDIHSIDTHSVDTHPIEPNSIEHKSVLIVGAGALGTPAALAYLLLNIGKITILDYDTPNESNLARQIFYYDSLGKPKSVTLSEKLRRISDKTVDKTQIETEPSIQIETQPFIQLETQQPIQIQAQQSVQSGTQQHKTQIESINGKLVRYDQAKAEQGNVEEARDYVDYILITPEELKEREFDLIVSCVDNFSTRLLLNKLATKFAIPLVHGGTSYSSAKVTLYIPQITSCPNCLFDFKYLAKDEVNRDSCDNVPEPSIITTSKICAGLMVGESLLFLSNAGSISNTPPIPNANSGVEPNADFERFINGYIAYDTFESVRTGIVRTESICNCGKK